MNRLRVLVIFAVLVAWRNLGAQETPALDPTADLVGLYAAADAHADSAPESAERSVEALAAYLAGAGTDDLTRARAIYRWLARNVEYDVDGLRSGKYGDVSPSGVLRSRSSVCSGYARLAVALGRAMGLEIEVVNGWSKGYGTVAGQPIGGRTDHAWNAVRIDGTWRLMDPTWGAGYLNEQMKFTHRFQGHYFLTAPEMFIFDHLPEEERWQLLHPPVSAAEYADLVYLQPMFFLAGLRVESHERVHIAAEDHVSVTLGVTRPVRLSAAVVDAASGRRLDGQHAFAQVSEGRAEVRAVFPEPGDYLLRIFAKPLSTTGAVEWALDYRVSAAAGSPEAVFPTVLATFGEQGAWLVEPLDGVLDAGGVYRFLLNVPGALQVAAFAGGTLTYFKGTDQEFNAELSVEPGSLVVCAKYEPADQCRGLLRYTIR